MTRGTLSIPVVLLFVSSLAAAQAQQSQGQTQDQSQTQATSQTQPEKQASGSNSATAATAVAAQPPAAQSTDSLADAARRAREQQHTEQPKHGKVWDNDSIEAMGPLGSITSASQNAKASDSADKADAAKPSSPSGGDEASWRKKFSDARDKLDKDQQDLTLLQRELGDLSVQYYADPTKGMEQGYSQSDLTKQRQKIDDKQKEIDADKQAISDLEDSLHQAGGDPGWAR